MVTTTTRKSGKRMLFLLVLAIFALPIWGKPIDENTARQVAIQTLSRSSATNSAENGSPQKAPAAQRTLQLLYKNSSNNNDQNGNVAMHAPPENTNETVYFYVFGTENNEGFVIVAGDDRVAPVLGYSYTNGFFVDNMPPNLQWWLGEYARQIEYAIENNIEPTAEIQQQWEQMLGNEIFMTNANIVVGPLLNTTWNQGKYYNDECPICNQYQVISGQVSIGYADNQGDSTNTNNDHVPTGCTATAMAQVMKYYNYPAYGEGWHSYNHSTYGTLSANFGATAYNWSNMPSSLSSANNAVATLMYHCGVAVETNYAPICCSSCGSSADTDNIISLTSFFRYDSLYYRMQNFYEIEWDNILRNELSMGRPILYASQGSGSHIFVCDGYKSENYFHFNWGWGGMYDCWFHTSALTPGSHNYNLNHLAIINIKPATPWLIGSPTPNQCISTLANGTLTISGVGATQNWSTDNQPWNNEKNSITNVIINNGVTTIGNNAFADCNNLTSVDIPYNVTSIGTGAFQNCTGLTDITVNWEAPPAISPSLFAGINTANITLYVPSGTACAYLSAPVWQNFNIMVKHTYHPDDKEGLRMFLRQPSAEANKINAEQLGLTINDTLLNCGWQLDEEWVTKIAGLAWNNENPKRLIYVADIYANGWTGKNLAGTLDANKWTALTTLLCHNNQLTELNIRTNTALKSLYCENNQIAELDVSANTELIFLDCSYNQLTELDVSANTELIYLYCYNNQLAELDISANTALTTLYCYDNQLTELDVRTNTALTALACSDNQLTELNVSANTALTTLGCENNQLTELNISTNTALTTLLCHNNQLTELNVSTNTVLTTLWCHNNHLSLSDLFAASERITVQANKLLGTQNLLSKTADVGEVLFSSDAVFNGIATQYSNIRKNGIIALPSDYTISNGTITFNSNGIYSVTMTNSAIVSHTSYPARVIAMIEVGNIKQQIIRFTWEASISQKSVSIIETNGEMYTVNWGDGITETMTGTYTSQNLYHTYSAAGTYEVIIIGTTTNCFFTAFICNDNQLTTLDVSANTALTYLYCENNQLTELNVNNNTELMCLSCYNNQLTTLDVSTNTELVYLWCHNNQLAELDVSTNTALTTLWCHNNHLSLSDLYAASEKITVQSNKYLGTQNLLPQTAVVGEVIFSNDAIFNGITTQYSNIRKNGSTAPASSYTISNGTIKFNSSDTYSVTMTNSAIVSHTSYPAKVISEITVLNTDASLINLTVNNGTGSGVYDYGSSVEIEATPQDNYHFTQWNDNSTENPRNVTVTQDTAFTAEFAIDTHTLTVINGTGSGVYDYGSSVEIEATPQDNYHFVQWNDGSRENPRIIFIVQDTVFTAELTLHITEIEIDKGVIKIYPNPTNGKLTVENPNFSDNQHSVIELSDLTGKRIATYKTVGIKTEIDISHLPIGMYMLKIGNNNAKVIKK